MKDWGLKLDPQWWYGAEKSTGAISFVAIRLRQAARLLNAHRNSGYPRCDDPEIALTARKLAALSREVRGYRVWGVCAWCKGQEPAINGCAACGGTAVMFVHQWKNCPPELLDPVKLSIYDHGKLVRLDCSPAVGEDLSHWLEDVE